MYNLIGITLSRLCFFLILILLCSINIRRISFLSPFVPEGDEKDANIFAGVIYGLIIGVLGTIVPFMRTSILIGLPACILVGIIYQYTYPENKQLKYFIIAIIGFFLSVRLISLSVMNATIIEIHFMLAIPFVLGLLSEYTKQSRIKWIIVMTAMLLIYGLSFLGFGLANGFLWTIAYAYGVLILGSIKSASRSLIYALGALSVSAICVIYLVAFGETIPKLLFVIFEKHDLYFFLPVK